MSARLSPFATLFLLTIIAFVSPVSAISISVSSGGGGESVSSSDTFDLDDATALQQNINLEAGSIFKLRQADGSGNNSISESINGNDFSLENNIQSSGTFSTSSSVSANTESGILSQDVAGTGSMSVSVSGTEGSREASQAASVYYGALDSVQAIGAGQGGAYAAQGTGMIGEGGSILSGAVGDENVMGATGTFTGAGLMSADLASFASSETGRATSDGAASLDGVTLIDSGSFEAVSSQSLEMGLEGLRDVGDGSVGGFDLNVLNLEQAEKESAAATSTNAAATAGGSYSSYVLTGYRWNQNNPQVQLYLNPKNAPSGITESETQSAVAAAANTWDDAVSSNLFADGATVIIDNSKTVDNPFSSTPVSDRSNVVGWANMGSSYLGMCRWWSNGATKDGYKSILEADTWFASDKTWTTDLSKATGSTFDIQSVAVHELGHTIGLGDLYTLPSSDSRKYDWNQVMNSYDGAQRTLGNGDQTGAWVLYGVPVSSSLLGKVSHTIPGATNWKSYGNGFIYLDIDTSSAGFTSIPLYFASLGGSSCQWEEDGITAIYSPTSTGFRIYLRSDTGRSVTPEFANQNGWYVQWIGVPKTETKAGQTISGATNWQSYGSNNIYLDIDTSSAGFAETPNYFASLGGSTCQWEEDGITAIYSPTSTGFRVYLRSDTGRSVTPEFANQNGWYVQWLGVPKTEAETGQTLNGATNWQAYGSSGLYLDVDTSSAGLTKTPIYLASLSGSSCQWEEDGVSAIYSPTSTGFRVYLRSDTGRSVTSEFANLNGWYLQWIGANA